MLKNALILIPDLSGGQQVCDFVWQTALGLSKNNQVYIINFNQQEFKKNKNIRQIKPFNCLPFSRFTLIKKINQHLYKFLLGLWFSLKFPLKRRYLLIFFPQLADLLSLRFFAFSIVFDIVDFHFSFDSDAYQKLQTQKKKILDSADYIFSISKSLKKLYENETDKEIHLVKQGFDYQTFKKRAKKSVKVPDNKPIIGFVGQISMRLDFLLLDDLLKNNPNLSFVFIGPLHYEPNVSQDSDLLLLKEKFNQLLTHPNFFHYDKQERNKILSFIETFDLAIIPYDASLVFNRYCYPMKLFEYFYAGKPVISSNIKELQKFPNFVKIAYSRDDWQKLIFQLLNQDWSKKQQQKQRKIALVNSWENKLNEIMSVID